MGVIMTWKQINLFLFVTLTNSYKVGIKTLRIASIPKKNTEEPTLIWSKDSSWPENAEVKDKGGYLTFYCQLLDEKTKKNLKETPEQFAILLSAKNYKKKFPVGFPEHQQFQFAPAKGKEEDNIPVVVIQLKALPYRISGKYTVTLLVADRNMERPYREELGDLHIKFSQEMITVNVPHPERKIYAIDGEKDWNPTKPISHLYRDPDPRPPHVIPLIFLILAWGVPTFVLFIGLKLTGANYGHMPKGQGFIWNMAFQGLMVFVGVLLLGFFTTINLVELTKIITPTFVVLIFVGNKSLCLCKDERYIGAGKKTN